MLELTSQNFEEEVIKSDLPVLVDFWSPTCPPCLILGPIIEEIAREFEGKVNPVRDSENSGEAQARGISNGVKVGKLNVMENPETAKKYEIVGIPTIIIFKDGEVKERATGVRPKQVIVDKLNLFL